MCTCDGSQLDGYCYNDDYWANNASVGKMADNFARNRARDTTIANKK